METRPLSSRSNNNKKNTIVLVCFRIRLFLPVGGSITSHHKGEVDDKIEPCHQHLFLWESRLSAEVGSFRKFTLTEPRNLTLSMVL